MKKPYRGSPTRRKFLARKAAKRKQRADEAYSRAHTLICQGKRRRHGRENQPCEWPIQFRRQEDGTAIACRRCGQLHRSWGEKWFKAEDYKVGKYDAQKAESSEGDYGYEPWYTPGERPNHDPDCGYKDFDLIGLHRTERKTVGGPGVIKIGVAMVDRFNVVRHWCRPAK